MTITETKNAGRTTLVLSGRLDAVGAPELQEKLLPLFEDGGTVELDFADAAYVSSAGLRVLLLGAKAAEAKKGVMTLRNVPRAVKEIFDMTGFSDILNLQ
ncbi:MAG: STAS domain-containing protein [Synergistaceae bacterium]|jgi:anti-anti-sigma factor|nr:STAS domain-containing protein [Synergistaceae bacterium]